ncbi:MAG: DUF1049 domain-containing protein [Pseudohongiella sp.]|nr:DUF1049 domain-containing protein [Pseudohongiella sp.]
MHKITRLLSAFFLILVFAVSVTFSYFNSTEVIISFASWQFPSQPVSVWVIGAFVSGGSLGLLLGVGIFRSLKSRAEIRRLRRLLGAAEQELKQLRTISAKGPRK